MRSSSPWWTTASSASPLGSLTCDAACLPQPTRSPERALGVMLAAMRAELTDGSAPQFIELLESITLDGIGRFFRLVLSLSSPRFVLGKVP